VRWLLIRLNQDLPDLRMNRIKFLKNHPEYLFILTILIPTNNTAKAQTAASLDTLAIFPIESRMA